MGKWDSKLKIFLLPLVLFSSALSGVSITAANAETLTWEKCVALAAQNNAELRAAEADLESTEALERGAHSGFLPTVTGSLSGTRSNTSVVTDGDLVANRSSRTTNTYSATLSGSQNLFAGLEDLGRVNQAEANTRAARATLQTTKAKISYDLKSNFEALSFAKESVKLTSDILKRRGDNLRMVELQFQSGRENKGSLLLSRAYLNQANYDNLQATNAIDSARAQLAKTLGLDEDTSLDISGEVPVNDPPASTLPWTKIAAETPDHLNAAAKEDAAVAAVTIARSSFFPSLSLSGSAGRQDDHFFPDDSRWSVGVSLNFPLFSGLKDYSSLKSSLASRTSAIESRYSVDRDLIAKLKAARNAYAEAFEKLKVDESFRDAAQVRAEIARKKYNNGLLTFDDWDIIESDLINRQKVSLSSKRDRVVGEAAWEQAQGKGILP